MKNIEEEIYYNIFIPTARIKDIVKEILECKKSFDTGMEPISQMIMGRSGVGKTALMNYISSQYPESTEITDWGEQDKKEVLVVTLSPNSTKKDAATEMLKALGDPNPYKGNLLQQTKRIRKLLFQCGVKMIIIDEFSHIVQSNSSRVLGKTADWIKDIIKPPKNNPENCPKIPLVAFGMYNSIKILESNEQLDTLVSKKSYLFPYGITQEEEILYYKTFLMNFGAKIHELGIKVDFNDPDLYLRIFAASSGIPRLMIKLIACACSIHHSNSNGGFIDISSFESGFEKVFGKQKLNPFELASLKDITYTENITYTTWIKSKRSHSILGKIEKGNLSTVFDVAKSKDFL